MNPLYQMMRGQAAPMKGPASPMQGPVSPMQRMSMMMQAMQNPARFVHQAFPDIPDNIANNPGMILQYLQQTRGITNEQVQGIMNQMPMSR